MWDSKSGLHRRVHLLARELSSLGIRVNTVAPAFIETPCNSDLSARRRAAIVGATPLDLTGSTEVVVAVVRYPVSRPLLAMSST